LTGGGNFWLMSVAAFWPSSMASPTSGTCGVVVWRGVCACVRVRLMRVLM
jgi:hypothetical protein